VTLTATDTAHAVRRGELTARASVEAALERISRLDKGIGAFQIVRAERSLAEADVVDARVDRYALPLAGVPIAVKDNVAVSGEPMRDGSLGSDESPQQRDHEVVRRLRKAGAVVVGITKVPELCVFAATDSAFGITRNPWDRNRSPGGSSGGAAAAVAAGMVPVAHGNDGMGSIRIPSACCGLVGIKPGSGVVPADLGNGSWFDLAENGAIATTVADAALMLAVLSGRLALADTGVHPSLRIAVSTKAPIRGVPIDGEFAAAARAAGDLLGEMGHRVRAADPTYPTTAGASALARWFAGAELDAQLLADRTKLEPRNRRHTQLGRVVLKAGFPKESGRVRWRRRAEGFFTDFDVLITPGLAKTALPAVAWGRRSWLSNIASNVKYAPFAAAWNLAGWPAMVVPLGLHTDGLPLSIQLVARPGGESALLGIAAQLEQLHPWPRLAPDYR
jgi:amidase